jgi:imidazolonepropionase-like amidohydrolase
MSFSHRLKQVPGMDRLFLTLVLLVAPWVGRAQQPSAPPHYAIQGARIVTVSGRAIPNGTIVMANGIITAVGTDVTIPPEAWVIDGQGLTVYPGLIDGLTTLGLPTSGPPEPPRGRGQQPQGAPRPDAPFARGPEDRPATMPWLNAADELNSEDERIERWRNAGFTTAVTSPERGLFPGQAALVNLGEGRPNDLVVKTPVALRVNFQKGEGFRGFPNSIMGVISYVEQTFLDAAHYGQAWATYESSPRGLERPDYDRALEPISDALASRRLVMLPATWRREMNRVLRIGEEIGANTLVYGAHQGYEAAETLAARNVPVLVSLNWPKRDEDADPDEDDPLEVLRFRDRAPTTPGTLQRAGVRFAFYSDGIECPGDILMHAATAIDAGLSSDAAVRAFTLGAAEIYGVADRLGSLEEGKIANVTVTDGDLFDFDTKVRTVFVDGRKFDVPEPEPREASAAGEGMRGMDRDGMDRGRRCEMRRARPRSGWTATPMVADRGPVQAPDVMVIQNATVMTVTQGTIENGSVLIRNGKIVEVGQNVSVPRDATVIDASGRFVTPGIIDAHSHIAAESINEGSISVSAMVGIKEVLNPDEVSIYRALAGGVTTVNVLHGSANPIGGRNAVIKLRWGADADGLLLEGAPEGIKFALGENTKRERNPPRYPSTRMGVMDVIRQAFVDAQQYQANWQEYEQRRARGEQNLIPPRRDLKLETLAEVLDGSRLVHAHSYRGDEILQLLRLAEEFGITIATFQHVLEGYRVAKEIAEHGAGASTFSDWWAYKVEAYEAIPYNAALMTEKGVLVSINSDSGEEMRHLNQEAAKAQKWGGLSETEALKLVTLNPATQLRVDDRVGSIEVGKDADLVIFDGHPLSVYAVPQTTIVDGHVYFDREHDIARRQALADEKNALLEKQRQQQRREERVVTHEGPSQGEDS